MISLNNKVRYLTVESDLCGRNQQTLQNSKASSMLPVNDVLELGEMLWAGTAGSEIQNGSAYMKGELV